MEEIKRISYLYGQLLAVYQTLEDTWPIDPDVKVPTMAEQVWANYINDPTKYINKLESVKQKSKELYNGANGSDRFNADMYEHFLSRLAEIYGEIEACEEERPVPLDSLFIFGYYAELKKLVTYKFDDIKSMRKKLGWTQKEASKRLGVPESTLVNWETGQRVPPKYVEKLLMEKMAENLG